MEVSLEFYLPGKITWFYIQAKGDLERAKGWLETSQPLLLNKITVLGDKPLALGGNAVETDQMVVGGR